MTRESYHELPPQFGFMSLMPPSRDGMRIFLLESSEPDWLRRIERVQSVRFPRHTTDNHFHFHQERRFYPEKFRTNIHVLNQVYELDWWFTGFSIQSERFMLNVPEIPIIDFDSRVLLDIAFQQTHPILIRNVGNAEELFRMILSQRLEMQRRSDIEFHNPLNSDYRNSERYSDNQYIVPIREVMDRPYTPPRRRRYNDDDFPFVRPPSPPQPPMRNRQNSILNRTRNIIVQPAQRVVVPLPSHVVEALVRSYVLDEKACSITMIPFKEIVNVLITSCCHCFEKEALRRWMNENDSCPECRQKIDTTVEYRNKIEGSDETQQVAANGASEDSSV